MRTSDYQIVLTTCPDRATGEKLAETLVAKRLAACVNIMPAMSVYSWKGKIEKAEEHVLIIKSTSAQFDNIRDTIRETHPYELPEVVAVPIVNGLKEYLEWLKNPEPNP